MRKKALLVGTMMGFFWLPVSQNLALAAEQKEFLLAWSEISPLILGHEVVLVLPDSTRIQGDAIAVSEDMLKLDVKKTSNSKEYPKGQANIPRSAVSVIEVNNKMGKSGRFIGKTAGGVGGAALGVLIVDRLLDNFGPVGAISTFAASVGGVTILGHFVGRHFDRKIIHIKIIPDTANSEARQGAVPNEIGTAAGKGIESPPLTAD